MNYGQNVVTLERLIGPLGLLVSNVPECNYVIKVKYIPAAMAEYTPLILAYIYFCRNQTLAQKLLNPDYQPVLEGKVVAL